MNSAKVMILVVAYNAEKTIKNLLDRIPKEIWDNSSEVLVSDDSSQDKTTEKVKEYKSEHKIKKLTAIRHKKNKGYGGNQKWCYRYAMDKGYDFVVMLHGDIQYSPEDIPRLLKPLLENKKDMVFGSRMAGNPLKGGMPIYKFIGNKFLTIVENITLKQNLTEYHSGFRLYSMKALKEIPFHLCSDGYHFDSEIIVQLVIAKKRIGEFPISTHYGEEICYVKVIPYGLNILKTMAQYTLQGMGLANYPKYAFNKK